MHAAAEEQRKGHSQLFDELSQADVADPRHPSSSSSNRAQLPDPPHVANRSGALSAGVILTPSRASQDIECPDTCRCGCHRLVQATPHFLKGWLGEIYVPSTTLMSLITSNSCDDRTCQRRRQGLMAIKWWAPAWVATVDANIRFQRLPLDLRIQSARVVEDLFHLEFVGLDEIRKMLSSRQITLNDVDKGRWSILHVRLYIILVMVQTLTARHRWPTAHD